MNEKEMDFWENVFLLKLGSTDSMLLAAGEADKAVEMLRERAGRVQAEIEKEILDSKPDSDYEWNDVKTGPPPLGEWVEVKLKGDIIIKGICLRGRHGLFWEEQSANKLEMRPMMDSDRITHWRRIKPVEKEIPSPEPDPDYEWHDVITDPPPTNIWVEVRFRNMLIMEGIYSTGGGVFRWMERSGRQGKTQPVSESDKITHWRRIKPKSLGGVKS